MNLFVTKKRMVIIGIVSFLLVSTTTLGYQVEHGSKLFISVPVIVACILGFALTAVLLSFLYRLFDKADIKKGKHRDIPLWKVFAISLICLSVLCAFQFFALYPGLFVFDASWQCDMYANNLISEHHSVLHTVLMGFLIEKIYGLTGKFNYAVAAYTIFQCIIYSVSISYVITVVFKKLKRVWVLTVMILYFGFYPPLVLEVMSATKDTLFFIFLLLSITLSFELADDTEGFIRKPVKVALWIISLVLSMIFRNNCIYAVPFFILALFVCLKRKVILVMFSGVLFLFALYRLFFVPAFVTVETDGREMLSVPAQQVLRIYSDEGADIKQDEVELIEKLFSEKGRLYWQPKIADFAKGSIDMDYYSEHFTEIKSTYWSLVRRNPKLSLEAFLELSCGFWYPGCELTLYMDGTKGYWPIDSYPVISMAESNTKIKPVYDFYTLFDHSEFVTKNPITSLLFAPGSFFYVFVIMFAYAVDRHRRNLIPSFTFVLVLWLTYLLGPVALVRYAIYLMAMLPLYLLLVFSNDRQGGAAMTEDGKKAGGTR